jgi:hypothetical protein
MNNLTNIKDLDNIIFGYKEELEIVDNFSKVLNELKEKVRIRNKKVSYEINPSAPVKRIRGRNSKYMNYEELEIINIENNKLTYLKRIVSLRTLWTRKIHETFYYFNVFFYILIKNQK